MLKTYLKSFNYPLSIVLLLVAFSTTTYGQNSVAIGSPTVKDNAVLWLNGNGSQGLLLPSTPNVNNITAPDAGMIVYQTSDEKIYYRNASAWVEIGAGSGGGSDQTLNYNSSTGELTISGGAGNTVTLSGVGDVSGNLGNITVTGLQGNAVDNTALTNADNGKVLQWDGSKWIAVTLSGSGTDDQAANEVPVTAQNGVTSTDAQAALEELQGEITTNATAISDKINTSSLPTPGDLLYNNGGTISNLGIGSTGQVLQVSGGLPTWLPAAAVALPTTTNAQILVNDGTSLTGTTLTGDVTIDNTGATTVTSIQGETVAATTPTANQVLQYNAGQWTPTSLASATTPGLGAVLTQDNDAGATTITNLPAPTAGTDAATKDYIDNLAATNNITGSFAAGFMIANDVIESGNIVSGTIDPSDIQSPGNDFVLTTAADGTVTWIAKSSLSGTTDLSGLSDANIVTPVNGNLLIYDGTTDNQFENVALSGDAAIASNGTLTIADGAISGGTGGKLTDGSVTTDDISNGTITGTDIANGTVAPVNIAGNGTTRSLLATATSGNVNWVAPTGDNQVLGSSGTGDLVFRPVVDAGTGIASPGSDANLVTEAAVRAAIPVVVVTNDANNNVFGGTDTGGALSTGANNVALGNEALRFSTDGNSNIAIGGQALLQTTSGSTNVAIGAEALNANTTGSQNVGIGEDALNANTIGTFNTAIGAGANVSSGNLTNATAVGAGAIVGANNTMRLGQDNTAIEFNGALTPNGLAGNPGEVLTSAGSGAVPTWTTAGSSPFTLALGVISNISSDQVLIGDVGAGIDASNKVEIETNTKPRAISIDQNYTGSLTTYGVYSDVSGDGDGEKYGFFSDVDGDAGQVNPIYGIRNDMAKGNTEDVYGIYNTGEDYNYFSGRLGIGITTPAHRLDVDGSMNVSVGNEFLLGGVRFLGGSTTADNVFVGGRAGNDLVTGSANVMVGTNAGAISNNTFANTIVGNNAALLNTTGGDNTFFGSSSGGSNTTGDSNTFIGLESGLNNLTGSFNTMLGSSANTVSDNLSYATAIGADARVTTSNTVRLGRDTDAIEFNGPLLPAGPGSEGTVGQVLTSDAFGLASWQTSTSSPWTLSSPNVSYIAGGVSIGTTSVLASLTVGDILTGINPVMVVNRPDAASAAAIRFEKSASLFNIGITPNDDFAISAKDANIGQSSDELTISGTTGNVGIGTSTPTSDLQIGSRTHLFQDGSVNVVLANNVSEDFTFTTANQASFMIMRDGGTIELGNTDAASPTIGGNINPHRDVWLEMQADGIIKVNSALSLSDDAGTETVNLQAPADIPTSYDFILPPAAGTAGQVLSTLDATGQLAWTSAGATSTLQNAYDGDAEVVMAPGKDINIRSAAGVDYFHLIQSTNRLGLGLANPDYTLDIRGGGGGSPSEILRLLTSNADSDVDLVAQPTGTGNFNIRSNGGADALVFQTAGDNDRMIIDATGSVGIGTSSPSSRLQLATVTHLDEVGGTTMLANNFHYNGSNYVHTTLGAAGGLLMSPTEIGMYRFGSGTLGSTVVTNTARMLRLTADGVVINDPDENEASAALNIVAAGSDPKGLLMPRLLQTERDAIPAPADGLMVYNTTSNAFDFYNGTSSGWEAVGASAGTSPFTQGSGVVHNNSTDQVVIGNATPPTNTKFGVETSAGGTLQTAINVVHNYNGASQKFGVISNISPNGLGEKYGFYSIVAGNGSQVNTIIGIRNQMTKGNTESVYGIYNTGEDYNYFSGNVGIGNALLPSVALEITGDENTTNIFGNKSAPATNLTFQNSNQTDGNFSSMSFASELSNGGISEMGKIVVINSDHAVASATGEMAFLTKGVGGTTEKMRITNDGNVGIGDDNPSAKLGVSLASPIVTGLKVTSGNSSANTSPIVEFDANSINTGAFRLQRDGNVGIGSGVTTYKLDVEGGIGARIAPQTGGQNFLTLFNSNDGNAAWGINDGWTVNRDFRLYRYDNTGAFLGQPFTIQNTTGNVGIGTINPFSSLHIEHSSIGTPVSGDGLTIENAGASGHSISLAVDNTSGNMILYDDFTTPRGQFNDGTGAYTTISDIREKKNIEQLGSVLSNINKLNIKTYHFNSQKDDELKNIGVIAQELKELYPSLVDYMEASDRYTVDYGGLVPLAIKAIQEQQVLIDQLSKRVSELEGDLDLKNKTNTSLESKLEVMNYEIALIKEALGLDKEAKK